jgi:eight-cysteine-cluster-containing protein
MRRLVLALLLTGCTSSAPAQVAAPQAAAVRTPAVPATSPHYDLFEGTRYKNDCASDSDCHTGGCGREVCSAETKVITMCMVLEDQPQGATCGCVSGQCIWYR